MTILQGGILQVTGENDAGKTTFAFACGAQPEDICFLDDDIKGRNVVEEISSDGRKLGYHVDLIRETGTMTEAKFYDYCSNLIDVVLPAVIKKDRKGQKFDALIWDTFARFENTLQPKVVKEPGKYREVYSPKGDIKGAQLWQASFDLESTILSKLLDLAKLVIIVSHLKADSMNGVKTGRLVPDSKRPLAQKAFMRVYLRHNPDGSAPIGLILKRPALQKVTEYGVETINILPRKLHPITWARIREFWEHPVGDEAFLKGEEPNEDDISVLTPVLSAQQLKIFEANVELTKLGVTEATPVEESTDIHPTEEDILNIKQMKVDGVSIPNIARDMGFPVPVIARVLREK